MTTTDTMREALQHIAAGHDVVCTNCGWMGEWHHLVGTEQRPSPHLCPDCGDQFLEHGANEIAAYALRQIEGGGE